MYSASVTVNLSNDLVTFSPNNLSFFGSATSTNISSYAGSATISLPASMHTGTAAKTYVSVNQIDSGTSTRAKLSFSYSVASNCQTATIYFRDVTSSITNGSSISLSFIVVQDRS
jgi:hypothetical protein